MERLSIPVIADSAVEVVVELAGIAANSLFEESEHVARDNCESRYQIVEGCSYDYQVTEGFELVESEEDSGLIVPNRFTRSRGRITPKQYVGTIAVDVAVSVSKERVGRIFLEVRSRKADYRSHYRTMLRDIADTCIELIMKSTSPAFQSFQVDHEAASTNLYQRFAFLRQEMSSPEFGEALARIASSPTTRWKSEDEVWDVRQIRRLGSRELRQMASGRNRIPVESRVATANGIALMSAPRSIISSQKVEDLNTPENQFVKHAIESFRDLAYHVAKSQGRVTRVGREALEIEQRLSLTLTESFLKKIDSPKTLHLNSPALQRKQGYRQILRSWIIFNLAAKLNWNGLEDVYSINKRDVATLYEYWCFLEILKIVDDVFGIAGLENLIEATPDGFDVKLRRRSDTVVSGRFAGDDMDIDVKLCFNRTFAGGKEFPSGGSWTKPMRPDITLTLWPAEMDEAVAEEREAIVHIHFDSKYKLDRVERLFDDSEFDDEREEEEQSRRASHSTVKRVDLMTMHAYRDAIRRTSGAYVLYPGESEDSEPLKAFKEVLPGLGAFALQPGGPEAQVAAIKQFLEDVLKHFQERDSHDRRMAQSRRDSSIL